MSSGAKITLMDPYRAYEDQIMSQVQVEMAGSMVQKMNIEFRNHRTAENFAHTMQNAQANVEIFFTLKNGRIARMDPEFYSFKVDDNRVVASVRTALPGYDQAG